MCQLWIGEGGVTGIFFREDVFSEYLYIVGFFSHLLFEEMS